MKYERFEQLPVWQAGMTLAEGVFALTGRRAFARLGELKDQVRRAALSVSNNVAEGFERGTTAELLSFLYIARGSAGEVRSMLIFCERMVANGQLGTAGPGTESEISNLKSEISNLKSEISNPKSEISNPKSEISDLRSEIARLKALAESCSRQLRGWADQLQNSDIAGPRRLTDKSRTAWQRKQDAGAFWQHIQDICDAAEEKRRQEREHPETAPETPERPGT